MRASYPRAIAWLPRIQLIGATICERHAEYEGYTVQILWGRWVIEFTLAKVDRRYG